MEFLRQVPVLKVLATALQFGLKHVPLMVIAEDWNPAQGFILSEFGHVRIEK